MSTQLRSVDNIMHTSVNKLCNYVSGVEPEYFLLIFNIPISNIQCSYLQYSYSYQSKFRANWPDLESLSESQRVRIFCYFSIVFLSEIFILHV